MAHREVITTEMQKSTVLWPIFITGLGPGSSHFIAVGGVGHWKRLLTGSSPGCGLGQTCTTPTRFITAHAGVGGNGRRHPPVGANPIGGITRYSLGRSVVYASCSPRVNTCAILRCFTQPRPFRQTPPRMALTRPPKPLMICLLYTSDAADDLLCV